MQYLIVSVPTLARVAIAHNVVSYNGQRRPKDSKSNGGSVFILYIFSIFRFIPLYFLQFNMDLTIGVNAVVVRVSREGKKGKGRRGV